MLIYSLLKRESKLKFIREKMTSDLPFLASKLKELDGDPSKINYSQELDFDSYNEDNWYRYLLNDLIANFNKSEPKKIDILTFNYDLSLEYYISSRLNKVELLKSDIDNFLLSLNIQHVYGSLYQPSKAVEMYGKYFNSKKTEDKINNNTQCFIEAYSLVENIKTMYEAYFYDFRDSLIKN